MFLYHTSATKLKRLRNSYSRHVNPFFALSKKIITRDQILKNSFEQSFLVTNLIIL